MKKARYPKLSVEPTIDPSAVVLESELGQWTEVGARTCVQQTRMGDYSYVVNDSDIIYSDIGKFVNIASHTRINPGQHPMDRASLHHFQYRSADYGLGSDDMAFFDRRRAQQVVIGHDVWIGHGAVIQSGVKIGTGSVIGSSAVVTQDVPPYTIVVGVPAQILRPRFTQDMVESLLRISWWDWPHTLLKERLSDFRYLSVQDFCAKYDHHDQWL